MTPQQAAIIQHSIGVDQYGNGHGGRSHFVTDSNCDDGLICQQLVAAGLMDDYGPQGEMTGGLTFYRVNENGKRMFYANCPKPPKQTRGQQRYLDFIRSDSGLTFIEWLKQRKEAYAYGSWNQEVDH